MAKNRKLSEEEQEMIIANAKASLSIEDLIVTDEETEIVRHFLKGDLTEKEVLEIIKNS